MNRRRRRIYTSIFWIASVVMAVSLVSTWSGMLVLLREHQESILFPTVLTPDAGPSADAGDYARGTARTSDGVDLSFLAAPPTDGMPTVVYVHGSGTNGGRHAADMHPFRAMGYGVVLAEFRGQAGNAGERSGPGFVRDVAAQVEWTRRAWPSSPLVVWGESLGTEAATKAAASHDVSALVLDAPYTSMTDIQRGHHLPWPPRLWLRDPMDALSEIRKVSAPVFVVQGQDDHAVPPWQGRAMAAAAPCLGGTLFMDGVGHPGYAGRGDPKAIAAITEFLGRVRTGTVDCGVRLR